MYLVSLLYSFSRNGYKVLKYRKLYLTASSKWLIASSEWLIASSEQMAAFTEQLNASQKRLISSLERLSALSELLKRSSNSLDGQKQRFILFKMGNGLRSADLDLGTGNTGSLRMNCGVICIDHHFVFWCSSNKYINIYE